jgi:hypothetical protein
VEVFTTFENLTMSGDVVEKVDWWNGETVKVIPLPLVKVFTLPLKEAPCSRIKFSIGIIFSFVGGNILLLFYDTILRETVAKTKVTMVN